jgi:hypothetical protein
VVVRVELILLVVLVKMVDLVVALMDNPAFLGEQEVNQIHPLLEIPHHIKMMVAQEVTGILVITD